MSKEIIKEGFWYSAYQPQFPTVKEGKPFPDQGVIVRLLHLLQQHLLDEYLARMNKYNADYEAWHTRTPLADRVAEIGKPKWPGQDEEHPTVQAYRGWSSCRICGCRNGNKELTYGGYTWPEGYLHYVEQHNVQPSEGFALMLARAALDVVQDAAAFIVEQGSVSEIERVSVVHASDTIAALTVKTKVRKVRVTGTGSSDTTPTVFLDLNNGDDGDDTGIAFPGYKGWSVFSASRVKHGCNVVLLNNGE